MGIATIHQHIPFVPTLSVLENVFLGEEGRWRRNTSDSAAGSPNFASESDTGLIRTSLVSESVDRSTPDGRDFSGAWNGRRNDCDGRADSVPCGNEREVVYRIVRHLSSVENKAIVFVSHFLDEVVALTDRVTISERRSGGSRCADSRPRRVAYCRSYRRAADRRARTGDVEGQSMPALQ